MKIAFQANSIEQICTKTDSTWRLIEESLLKGYEVFHFKPRDVFWQNELFCYATSIHSNCLTLVKLDQMDVIFIRQNPPFDIAFFTSLQLLEKIADKVLILNNPKAIHLFPEKISVLDFPELIPPTLITYNEQQARDFAKNYPKIILKPLYSYASKDVFHLSEQDEEFSYVVEYLLEVYRAPFIVQKAICKPDEPDKRIILIDGEPIAALMMYECKDNGYKAQAGIISDNDKKICNYLSPMLKANNLFFVGIDIINDYLIEINITSPTGIVEIEKFFQINIAETILDKIENKLTIFS